MSVVAQRQPRRTVFTRVVPPARAEDAPGSWRRYFERRREFTGERIDPRWIELVLPLAALVPPDAPPVRFFRSILASCLRPSARMAIRSMSSSSSTRAYRLAVSSERA